MTLAAGEFFVPRVLCCLDLGGQGLTLRHSLLTPAQLVAGLRRLIDLGLACACRVSFGSLRGSLAFLGFLSGDLCSGVGLVMSLRSLNKLGQIAFGLLML